MMTSPIVIQTELLTSNSTNLSRSFIENRSQSLLVGSQKQKLLFRSKMVIDKIQKARDCSVTSQCKNSWNS